MIGLLGFISVSTYAQEEMLVSRSAGKMLQDDSIDLTLAASQGPPVFSPTPDASQTRDVNSPEGLRQQTGIANRYDQYFSIYDADVQLIADLDGDGYHHALNVYFDVDAGYGHATVYVKLYLSQNGGPWSHYYTTDLFEIYADDYSDAYEVSTELVEGYSPDYYDILIEVFSLDHADMVTSLILDLYYLDKYVLLEDLGWDQRDEYYYEEESFYYGGGGSFSLLYLLLILQVVIAARGASTKAPEK
jgi:hypothetical protein